MLLQQDSHIWNKNSKNLEFVNSLRTLNLSDEEFIKRLEDHDLYGIRITDDRVKECAMRWYRVRGFYGNNPNDVKMNYYLDRIKELTGVKTILEIGGGMGKLAEKLIDNGYEYTDVDITESLYCADIYLKNRTNDEWKVLRKTYKLVDISNIESLYGREFDLVVNTHSMGEMSNNDVQFWMDFIQNKIKVKYFFGVNRFLNTVSDDEYSQFRKDENIASISFDNMWDVLDWEYSPLVLNCPYEDTRAARCLEVVLRRQSFPDGVKNDINDIKLQDWFRYEPRVGTNLSNPLRIELGMYSTLFNLWNNIRVHPSKENIQLMQKYLSYLSGERMFEEQYAYTRMLNDN